MNAKERQAQILEILDQQGFATVKQLVDLLEYSSATVNRDLNALEERHLVLRSYGGVLVTAKKKGGRITAFSVKSNAPTEIKIRNDFGAENLTFSNGEKIHCKQGEIFTLRVENTAKLVTK